MNEEDKNRSVLEDDVQEYVQLRLDAFKLKCVDHLSTLLGQLISIAVVLFFAGLAFLAFLMLLLLTFAGFMGWYVVLAIAGVCLALLALLVYVCRKQLFRSLLVETLCQMFFEKESEKK